MLRGFRTPVVLSVALLGAASAFAGDVKMSVKWNNQDAPGAGGPFTATLLPSGRSFLTYCIEGNEYISNNGMYYREIARSAKNGGQGGPNPDPLSSGAAWLYRQVHDAVMNGQTNALTALTWDGGSSTFDASNINDLAEIQRVIWSFEQESFSKLYADRFDAIVSLVQSNVGAGYLYQGKLYGVRVMRLWTNANYTGNAQDQLIVVPMPAPVGLAGLGLIGIASIRRR